MVVGVTREVIGVLSITPSGFPSLGSGIRGGVTVEGGCVDWCSSPCNPQPLRATFYTGLF